MNHKHYIPILKTKAGEQWAVEHLANATRSGLTPLFEIHQHANTNAATHAEKMCTAIRDCWGTTAPCFIDLVWLQPPSGDQNLLLATFQAARNVGVQAIPVVRTNFGMAALNAIQQILALDSRGYMLRLPQSEIGGHAAINGVVATIGAGFSDIDLLMDYGNRPMDLPTDVPTVLNVNSWRTFAAASGMFPRSVANFPLTTWNPHPRFCWTSWVTPVTGGGLSRRPTFADYILRDPGAPAAGGNPPVALKYTKDDYWLIRVDGKLQQGHAPRMVTICQSLIARPEYDGAAFSHGDRVIHDTANHITAGPGGAQQWLQWGQNHHMTFVVNQIQLHPGL